ncbi:hypothetical protein BQ8420_03765 [Nocardiopsis sp. JB363]|nr:hypothetical protein BQ8420_03765 [Nocardiopsis sp. JB363]
MRSAHRSTASRLLGGRRREEHTMPVLVSTPRKGTSFNSRES